jgi:hypothetical protein
MRDTRVRGQPLFQFSTGRSRSMLNADFEVIEAVHGPGCLDRFHATSEQRCGGNGCAEK